MLPCLTGRRHAAAIDVMTSGYTTPEEFRETCVRVVGEAHWVVIDRAWSDPSFIRKIFPALRDPEPPETRGFEATVRRAFDDVVHATPTIELRRRSASASAALCDWSTSAGGVRGGRSPLRMMRPAPHPQPTPHSSPAGASPEDRLRRRSQRANRG